MFYLLLSACGTAVNSPDFEFARIEPAAWTCAPQTFGSHTCERSLDGTRAHVQVAKDDDLAMDVAFPTWAVKTRDYADHRSTFFDTMHDGHLIGVAVWFEPNLPEAQHAAKARELFDMVHFKGLPSVPYEFTGPRPVIDRDDP